jgi:hypothetical protein
VMTAWGVPIRLTLEGRWTLVVPMHSSQGATLLGKFLDTRYEVWEVFLLPPKASCLEQNVSLQRNQDSPTFMGYLWHAAETK